MSITKFGAGIPYFVAGPLPCPDAPWHTAQLI